MTYGASRVNGTREPAPPSWQIPFEISIFVFGTLPSYQEKWRKWLSIAQNAPTYIKTDEVFHCCILGPWWNLHFAIRCGFPGFQWFIDCKQFAFSPFECHWGSWAWSGEPIASKDYILLIWKFRIFNEKKIKKDKDKNHRYTISKNATLCLTQWYCCPLGDVPQHLVILHWHVAENHFIIYA